MLREEASKPTVGGGGGATGSGGGLVFEMRGSLKVLLGQVEKDLGKRQMSTRGDNKLYCREKLR